MRFNPQNYTVTEGDVVNITLATSTSDYMFNFTVTLQHMDGSATGEFCSMTCTVSHFIIVSRFLSIIETPMVIVHL